ncbi:NAD(P)-binding protein, partial [Streptomyces sp. NPDC059627]
MRVSIVGGGIAGLTCALSLHAAGFRPRVSEAARSIEAVGVGINLLPHAVRELAELGLADELAAIALPPQRLDYYDRSGAPVWQEPLGTSAGYDWPQYSVHRGHLHVMLLKAVRERLGPDGGGGGARGAPPRPLRPPRAAPPAASSRTGHSSPVTLEAP